MNRKHKKTMREWLMSLLLAAGILLVVFLFGFVGINIYMQKYTGHENEVVVPDIEGKLFDVARKECRDLNLYVQEVDTQRSSKVDKGVIISQKPEAGFNAKIGRVIEVVVSAGPETVSVPSLFNLTVDEAFEVLQSAGLRSGQEMHQFSDKVEAGRIFFTDPATGTAVGRGARVNLYVSSGEMPSGTRPRLEHQRLLDDAGEDSSDDYDGE